MPGIDFSSAFSETQEKVWEPRSFTLSSFWTNSVSKCFWCQMHINSRSKLKNQFDLQNIRASRFPRRLPFGLRQSFFELHFQTTHSFHCGFLCWAEVCDSFKKKKKTPGTRVLSKWGIRCESDTTMLKGCKQPERNIASSNSCCISDDFPGGAHKDSSEHSPESHHNPEEAQNSRPRAHGWVTQLHTFCW